MSQTWSKQLRVLVWTKAVCQKFNLLLEEDHRPIDVPSHRSNLMTICAQSNSNHPQMCHRSWNSNALESSSFNPSIIVIFYFVSIVSQNPTTRTSSMCLNQLASVNWWLLSTCCLWFRDSISFNRVELGGWTDWKIQQILYKRWKARDVDETNECRVNEWVRNKKYILKI